MECLDFSSGPFAFFFCNFYACSDSFTPHRKRFRENHALCLRFFVFIDLSERTSKNVWPYAKAKQKQQLASYFLFRILQSIDPAGVWNKPESTVLKSGTLTIELTSWTYVPDFLRITFYSLVRHLSEGNRKFLAQIKNCFFFTELQPTKTGGFLQVLPTASFIWFIPRIHDWRETDYWTALTQSRRNYSRAWWHQVVKYIVIALGYSVCKSLDQRRYRARHFSKCWCLSLGNALTVKIAIFNDFCFNLLASVFSKFGYKTSQSLGLTVQENCTSLMFAQRTENSGKKSLFLTHTQ